MPAADEQHTTGGQRTAGEQRAGGDHRAAEEHARALRRAQAEAEQLRRELARRPVTALATGILAERLQLAPAEAADHLTALAHRAHRPPAELAADIIGTLAVPEEGERASTPGTADGGPVSAEPSAPAAESAEPPAPAESPEASELEWEAGLAVQAVLEHTGAMLGVTGVVLWGVRAAGALVPVATRGFRSAERAGWEQVPPGVDTPAQRVLNSGGGPYGPAGPDGPTLGRDAMPYRLALPVQRSGRLHGVLELAWPERPAEPTAAELRRLRALTAVCALVLAGEPQPELPHPSDAMIEAVLDAALLLDPVLDEEGEITDFRITRLSRAFSDPAGRPAYRLEGRSLTETYPLACSEGLLDLVRRVRTTGEVADRTEYRLTFLEGEVPRPVTVEVAAAPVGEHVLLTWRLTEDEDRQRSLLLNGERLARLGAFEEDLRTGEIHWNTQLYELHGLPERSTAMPLAALPAHVHPEDAQAVRRVVTAVMNQGRDASAVFRLVHPTGLTRYTRVVAEPVTDHDGRLVAVRGVYQDVSAQHWTEIALAATRERLADSEQEAAESLHLTLRLQQAILPPEPPPLDRAGLRAAVRYRPAAQRERVGGDWYDAALLPGDRALLAVGDMAGHGVEAATGMVALRNALRGLAVTGAGPGRLLTWLNLTADDLTEAATATAVCARYDPVGRELRWARAGHLPPILIRAGDARMLSMPRGVLLGATPEAEYEEHTLAMEPGDILLLYTDGLVESRGRSVEEPILELVADLSRRPVDDLEALLDRALARSTADTADDTCLLAVQVLGD